MQGSTQNVRTVGWYSSCSIPCWNLASKAYLERSTFRHLASVSLHTRSLSQPLEGRRLKKSGPMVRRWKRALNSNMLALFWITHVKLTAKLDFNLSNNILYIIL